LLPKQAKKNFMKKGVEYATFPADKEEMLAAKKGKDKKDDKKVRDVASDEYGWSAETDPKKMADTYNIGPIPAGVPVNLIVNLSLAIDSTDNKGLLDTGVEFARNKARISLAVGELVRGILAAQGKPAAEALETFMEIASPSLIAASKCSDFVVNRGHYFGTAYDPRLAGKPNAKGLTDEEKAALIEYVKYF
jgi:hypothetical protein